MPQVVGRELSDCYHSSNQQPVSLNTTLAAIGDKKHVYCTLWTCPLWTDLQTCNTQLLVAAVGVNHLEYCSNNTNMGNWAIIASIGQYQYRLSTFSSTRGQSDKQHIYIYKHTLQPPLWLPQYLPWTWWEAEALQTAEAGTGWGGTAIV